MSSEDRWSLATGEDNGKPVIFRIRHQAPPFARKADFPHLIAVTWPYESPNDKGMPAPEIIERMKELEDLLEAVLEGAGQAFVTVIATGNGVREWQWYSRDPNETMRLVNETLGECDPFPVQFVIQDDPDWEAYGRFQEIIDN